MGKEERFCKIERNGKKRYYRYCICPQCGNKFLKRIDAGYKHIRCSRKCYGIYRSENIRGKAHWNYRERTSSGMRGMVAVHDESGNRVYEHRQVYENVFNVKLKRSDIIHHIDADKSNNVKGNFLKCTMKSHAWIHQAMSYLYQVEVIRNAGITGPMEFIDYLLKKIEEHQGEDIPMPFKRKSILTEMKCALSLTIPSAS